MYFVSGYCTCMYICAPHLCLVSSGVERGCWTPWGWSDRWLWANTWMLRVESRSSGREQPELLIAKSSLLFQSWFMKSDVNSSRKTFKTGLVRLTSRPKWLGTSVALSDSASIPVSPSRTLAREEQAPRRTSPFWSYYSPGDTLTEMAEWRAPEDTHWVLSLQSRSHTSALRLTAQPAYLHLPNESPIRERELPSHGETMAPCWFTWRQITASVAHIFHFRVSHIRSLVLKERISPATSSHLIFWIQPTTVQLLMIPLHPLQESVCQHTLPPFITRLWLDRRLRCLAAILWSTTFQLLCHLSIRRPLRWERKGNRVGARWCWRQKSEQSQVQRHLGTGK